MSGVYEKMRDTRREEILRAAKARICSGSIAGTTMKDIASDLSISRQTLYKYFANIDEIAYAIQKEILQHVVEWRVLHVERCVRADLQNDAKALDALESTLTAFFRYADENPEDFLFVSIFDAHYSRNTAAGNLREDYGGFLKTGGHTEGLKKMIIAGKDAGVVAQHIDPEAASVMATNACFAVAQRAALLGGSADSLSAADKAAVEREFIAALMRYFKG